MSKFAQLRSRGVALKTAISAAALAAASSARADLPTWATSIGTEVSSTVTDAAELVGPAIALSIGAVLAIKLIKRFTNKI